jgi:hypothetical protein
MVEPLADQMVDLSRKVLTFLFPPLTPARKKRGRKTDPQTRGFPPRRDSSRRPSILPPEKSRAAASIILEKCSSEFVKGLPETARRKFADFFVQNNRCAAGFFARQTEVRIPRHKIYCENVRNSHICFARRKPFVI